jgi:hypothetical protein
VKLPDNAGLAAQGQFLSEESSSKIHKYTDIARILEKGRKSRKSVKNIIKLMMMI